MLKLIRSRHFPFVTLTDSHLAKQLVLLRKENDELRKRLAAAQQARVTSRSEAEELRSEKDRLKSRVTTHKKEESDLKKMNERLKAKVSELQLEIIALQAAKPKRK